jgi:serine/threonine protein kinase
MNNTFEIKEYIVYSKRIGSGAFSSIHKAYKRHTNRFYAVKKLNYDSKSLSSNTYKKEFSILRKIEHKNIIKLHDIILDKNNEHIYLVLDYYKNGDLSQFLKNRSLKEKYAKGYMFQLKDGLEYLIQHNIIHRDLKPQNILLDDNYSIKITDFGFARKFQTNHMISTICGSPMYMAPEILDKKKYSIKSDLWSVGIILYQMLYGKVPFKSRNIISLTVEIHKNNINYKCDYPISILCINLLTSLMTIDPDKRITWDTFFKHEWFQHDDILQDQNNLMEISFSNIPNLNNDTNESQFNSFIYKSIYKKQKIPIEEEEESYEEDDSSIEFNFNLNTNTTHTNNDDDDDRDDDRDDDYESCDSDIEHEPDIETEPYNNNNNINININRPSLPINIQHHNSHTISNSYIIVNKPLTIPERRYRSSRSINSNRSLSDSFKDYLSKSIEFVKHGYEYISNS